MASTLSITSHPLVNHGLNAARENALRDVPPDRGLVNLLSNPLVADEHAGSIVEVTEWLESMVAELEQKPLRARH